ncbi:MAG: hypothetical protein KatS3mg110_2879 [Pirellulaceae bacterium]|nr:MAG: hypothetical protein KatS3mg110_2879 [Pirellulaceae bacterium]
MPTCENLTVLPVFGVPYTSYRSQRKAMHCPCNPCPFNGFRREFRAAATAPIALPQRLQTSVPLLYQFPNVWPTFIFCDPGC